MNGMEGVQGSRLPVRRTSGWVALLGLPLGVLMAMSCGDGPKEKPCEHGQCPEPFVCDQAIDRCVCQVGVNGAMCATNTDCGANEFCNSDACKCEPLGETWDTDFTTDDPTDDPSDPTNNPSDPTNNPSDPTNDPSESVSETNGTTTDGTYSYLYVLILDNTEIFGDDHGCDFDAVQLYNGDDLYAVDAQCEFGAAADPEHSDCSQATGMKMFGACSPDDTHYVSLGGVGGSLIATMPVELKEGDVVTPVECGGGEYVEFSAFVGLEPVVDSPYWVPLELSPNNALLVPALPPPP